MTPERWQKVDKLLEQALEKDPDRRGSFLDEACAGDEELRREVESLLVHENEGQRFLELPATQTMGGRLADEPASLVGQHVGPYQILSLLGAGGMGEVYKTRDTRLNRAVAIKALPRHLSERANLRQRFVQEAKAASALNHPNVISLHDVVTDNGRDFIVMEYVPGKSLDKLIPSRGIRLNEALRLAIQIADALAKAHSAGIVHRDLKPSNVMVTEEGQVKVLDLGLAKLTEVSVSSEATTRRLLTEEGGIIGTPSYMAPEQAEGKRIDARSDIFSFGSVLYEMTTGHRAFESDSKMSTLAL